MPRVISVREYELRPDAPPAEFGAAVQKARDDNLLDLPGLEDYFLLRGIKGARARREPSGSTRAALPEKPCGGDDPIGKSEYPESWTTWEDEVLALYLSDDPDAIRCTSCRELGG